MQILVKALSGEVIPLDVNSTDTVESMKQQLHSIQGKIKVT